MGQSTYSQDLRERVVAAVGEGISRREAGRLFRVSASSAIRWVDLRDRTGNVCPRPRGHRRSPLEAHAAWLLELIAQEKDLTLEEIAARIGSELGVSTSKSSVDRFYARHDVTFKKKPARHRTGQARRR
jgi:transposase